MLWSVRYTLLAALDETYSDSDFALKLDRKPFRDFVGVSEQVQIDTTIGQC